MNKFFQKIVKIRGEKILTQLIDASHRPQQQQTETLLTILNDNRNTEYGRRYNFSNLSCVNKFQKFCPLTDYDFLQADIVKITEGEKNILTFQNPFMFNLTSGTTSKPKFIPVTKKFDTSSAALMRAWISRSITHHPKMFAEKSLGITSSETEGYTPSGIPFGSTSGRIYKRIPFFLRNSYAIPFWVSDIQNYEERYLIIARLALEQKISFVTSPNPSTLLKLSQVISENAVSIIREIHDGTVSSGKTCKKNPNRATFLESKLRQYDVLLPRHAWPELALIGCWLGGTVGALAERVRDAYGEVPIRDLGYLASEGRFTLPLDDETSFGLPDLCANFFEFIPTEEIENKSCRPLLIHEIQQGKSYYLFVTNWCGLYRYDMNDIVEVGPLFNKTPLLRFLRKGRDMGNITGEKLHANHCIEAMQKLGLGTLNYRFFADTQSSCYHLFIESEKRPLHEIDSMLQNVNIEYNAKRQSGRLSEIKVHFMKAGWAEAEKKYAVAAGQREAQYKWKIIGDVFVKEFEQ